MKPKVDRSEYMRNYRALQKQKKMATVTPITPGQNNMQQTPHIQNSSPSNSVTNIANTSPLKAFNTRRCFLLLLILCGSFFLVTEQVQFYEAIGYSFEYSVFLALLLETTPLALAYFAGVTKDPRLYYAIFPAVLCIGAVIFLGLRVKRENSASTAKITAIVEAELKTLNEDAKDAEGKALKKIEEKIAKKQTELKKQLSLPQSNDASWQLWIFALIRFLAFCYNLMFARLLAML